MSVRHDIKWIFAAGFATGARTVGLIADASKAPYEFLVANRE